MLMRALSFQRASASASALASSSFARATRLRGGTGARGMASASSPDAVGADMSAADAADTTTSTDPFSLDVDQRAFQDLAADFAARRLAPNAGDWDARSHFPVDVLREAAQLGFAGLYVPASLGGAGLSRLSASVIFEALATGDVPFSAYMSIHNMVAGAISGHAKADAQRYAGGSSGVGVGNEAANTTTTTTLVHQHERRRADLVARLVSMDSLAAYCLTEPQSGSDAASLSTTATRCTGHHAGQGAGWLLRGSKAFISGAGVADVYLVMARVVAEGGQGGDGKASSSTPPPSHHSKKPDPARGITAFVVDRRRPEGFDDATLSFGAKERKMGWRMQPTAAVHFDNVFVPDADVVGGIGQGFRSVALRALDGGRINIGACSVGGGEAALRTAVRYARERSQFGQPIANFQATRFRLADAATDVEASRLMVRRAAAALDRAQALAAVEAGAEGGDGAAAASGAAEEATALAAMAKRFASDRCFDVANSALQTLGGAGYLEDYGVERLVRDLRVHSILEGTNEVMRLLVARRIFSRGD